LKRVCIWETAIADQLAQAYDKLHEFLNDSFDR
jgi:hypothetical protein